MLCEWCFPCVYVRHVHARCPEEGVLSPFFAVFDQYSWSHPSHCRHAASLFAEDGRHLYLLQICPHQFPPPPHSAARLMRLMRLTPGRESTMDTTLVRFGEPCVLLRLPTGIRVKGAEMILRLLHHQSLPQHG